MLNEIEMMLNEGGDEGGDEKGTAADHPTTPTKKMHVAAPTTPPKHATLDATVREGTQDNPFVPKQATPKAQGPPTTLGPATSSTTDNGNQPKRAQAENITTLADLAELIKCGNSGLRRDFGNRIVKIEETQKDLSEGQATLWKQHERTDHKLTTIDKKLAKQHERIENLDDTVHDMARSAKDQLTNMQNRVEALEKQPRGTSGDANHYSSNVGDVIVVRGFQRDTKKSEIMETLHDIMKQVPGYEAEEFVPFRRGSIGKIRFASAAQARAALPAVKTATTTASSTLPEAVQLWAVPERSAAAAAKARPWTRAAWIARTRFGAPGVTAEVSTRRLYDANDEIIAETDEGGDISLTPHGLTVLKATAVALRQALAEPADQP